MATDHEDDQPLRLMENAEAEKGKDDRGLVLQLLRGAVRLRSAPPVSGPCVVPAIP